MMQGKLPYCWHTIREDDCGFCTEASSPPETNQIDPFGDDIEFDMSSFSDLARENLKLNAYKDAMQVLRVALVQILDTATPDGAYPNILTVRKDFITNAEVALKVADKKIA